MLANHYPYLQDLFSDRNQSCASVKPGSTRKTFGAFATPQEAMQGCWNATPPNGGQQQREPSDSCTDALSHQCSQAASWGGVFGCELCAKKLAKGTCTSGEATAWCIANAHGGGHHHSGCGYDQEAGALWDQRFKQLLVANGIAVIQLNPYEEDTWDNYAEAWKSGKDAAYLPGFFKSMVAGDFGPVNPAKVVLRGWSGGAQMVSWLVEQMARDSTLFPGVTLAAGIMLSGGSYQCYNDPHDPQTPIPAIGSCQGCTEGGPSHCQGDPKCDSCNSAVKPYCQQCCPKNYTEQYFADNPSAWHEHPPIFLSQTSTIDNHADLCACRNYFETLQAHGVKSQLVLVPQSDESCFCVGNPTDPAAAGSMFSGLCQLPSWGKNCTTMGGSQCCISHTMGNAVMMTPALEFILAEVQ